MATNTASPKPKQRIGDILFSRASLGAGIGILVILAAVAIFLIAQSLPGILASSDELKDPDLGFWHIVWPLVFGTVWAAFLALIIATPIALGIALYITHYAPRRLSQALGYIVDLLAAVPSVIYGLWGFLVLAKAVQPVYQWLNTYLGWIPLFSGQVSGTGRTILTAAIVLAVMILPIITALSREVFLQTPKLHEEAALALGATRWEMIKLAVIPFGKPGIISAVMLGMGRALGETMAVAMVLSPSLVISFLLLNSEAPATIASYIALKYPESSGLTFNTLIAAGLVLFIITFAVNMLARWIVSRRKEFSGAN